MLTAITSLCRSLPWSRFSAVIWADFKKLGVGISVVWVRELGSALNTAKYELISDVVLVSVVPAVSIQVDFEETPRTEIELSLRRHLSANDVVKCGRIKSPRE